MGFMDKAKQLAEQAQQKLEETQKQFNESQAAKAGAGGQTPTVRYDEYGRPIETEPAEPAAAAAAAPPPEPASGAQEPAPEAQEPAPEAPPAGAPDANPDPFKPLQ